MRVVFSPNAEADLADAFDWYNRQTAGLGTRFLNEYETTIDRISVNPRQFPVLHRETRRAGFHHFPYGLFFRIRPDEIEVFACLHASRDPLHWQRRQ